MKFYWTEDKITALADVAGLEGKPHKLTTREAAHAIVHDGLAEFWLTHIEVVGLLSKTHVVSAIAQPDHEAATMFVAPVGHTEETVAYKVSPTGEVLKQASQEMVDTQLYGASMAYVLHHGVEAWEALDA